MNYQDATIMNMLTEYEEILIGNRKQFSSYHFGENPARNHDIAIEAFRYLFDKVLCWDINTLSENLSYDLIKTYKLEKYFKTYIRFKNEMGEKARFVKDELSSSDITMLLGMIYPEYKTDMRQTTINVYNDVIEGKVKKFPKDFFSGHDRFDKAYICLQTALDYMPPFDCVESMYRVFADPNSLKMLGRY